MKESNWYGIKVCISCETRLNKNERTHTEGVCPKCGHFTNGTICDTKKLIIKETRHHAWWALLNRKWTYLGKNEESKEWLKKIN